MKLLWDMVGEPYPTTIQDVIMQQIFLSFLSFGCNDIFAVLV